MEVWEVAIGQQAVPGQQCRAGDELVLVVIEWPGHAVRKNEQAREYQNQEMAERLNDEC
jgi:hypothetical protein